MDNIIFECKDLSKLYQKIPVLQKVNLSLEKGKIYGLIGNNGAGKTTLLRILMGLTNPSSGSIMLFNDKSNSQISTNRSRIGALIDQPVYYGSMNARQNLDVTRKLKGIKDKQIINEVLSLLQLADRGKVKVRNYSLGMKQRLGIAKALIGNPEFLILDEPINGLDPSGIREIREMLIRLNAEQNTTILISSHYLEQLYQVATDYIIINRGQIVEQLTLEQLQDRCDSYIRVRSDEIADATAIIEEHFPEVRIETIHTDEIRVYQYQKKVEYISNVLSRNKIRVTEVSSVGMNLEEYFTELIGGGRHA